MADWPIAATARNDFADLIESLDETQLGAATLAGHWTPRDILGHIVFVIEMKMPSFMFAMAKAGFNYDKMADRAAQKNAQRSVAELVQVIRAGAAKSAPMPGFGETIPVGDVAVHTQDIRRPLGLPGELDPVVLRTALEFVTTEKVGIDLHEFPRRKEVSFRATDVDWAFGEGPEVAGPGESILMVLAGRASLDELTGDGVEVLR